MRHLLPLALALTAGCQSDNDKLLEDDPIAAVKTTVAAELDGLATASADVQAAAPATGWSVDLDPTAVETQKEAWRSARLHYERVEGAIAVLFPDLDVSLDERYDGFVALEPDEDLFDDQVVTGVHAVERILWADAHPPEVVAFESALPNYVPASFPTDDADALRYHDQLVQRLVDETRELSDRFEPLALDGAAAYGGVVGSMREQVEKLSLARTGEEESRYARYTAADMRANLEGGRLIYAAFSPGVAEQDPAADQAVYDGFDRMQGALDEIDGDSIPEVPEGWDPSAPSAEDLDTPYGRLWTVVQEESSEEGLVGDMTAAAALIDITVAP